MGSGLFLHKAFRQKNQFFVPLEHNKHYIVFFRLEKQFCDPSNQLSALSRNLITFFNEAILAQEISSLLFWCLNINRCRRILAWKRAHRKLVPQFMKLITPACCWKSLINNLRAMTFLISSKITIYNHRFLNIEILNQEMFMSWWCFEKKHHMQILWLRSNTRHVIFLHSCLLSCNTLLVGGYESFYLVVKSWFFVAVGWPTTANTNLRSAVACRVL